MSNDELGAATDRLNESLELLEGALTSLNLGVSASVELDDQRRLFFGKTSGGWKLSVVSGDGRTDLLNTSRETRLCAVEKIEELLMELTGEKDRQLALVLNAIHAVDLITNNIRHRFRYTAEAKKP